MVRSRLGIPNLVAGLRAIEREYLRARLPQSVPIPRCIVLGSLVPAEHDPECQACVVREMTGLMKSPAITVTAERGKALSQGRGIPLKVLLTLYRWARGARKRPISAVFARHDDDYDQYQDIYWYHDASASLSVRLLANQAGLGGIQPEGGVNREGRAPDERAAARAIKKLQELGLVEVLQNPGPAQASFYFPHRFQRVFGVPSGLWRNGWMERLDGPSLFLLLVLLGRQPEPLASVSSWRHTPRDLPALAEQGRLLVDATAVNELPVSDNTRRAALERLKDVGLVADGRIGKYQFIVLLNPRLDKPVLRRQRSAPG